MDEVAVLQHLSEQETILEVAITAPASNVDVLQLSKSRPSAAGAVNSDESVPGPVLVLGVTSGSIGVVETLNNLRPEDVRTAANVETGLFIECQLVCWWRGVVGVI